MASDSKPDIELRASYFQEFLLERMKIGEHKWLQSERQQRDIGWESALTSWVAEHRATWKKLRSRKAEN